jgi:hypothetical protein
MEILDNIPVRIDLESMVKRMRLRSRNEGIEENIRELIGLARAVARPKAVFKISPVEKKNGDSLEIDGVRFTSRVLRVNLDEIDTVYPYVVTCGREVDEIDIPPHEFMRFYLMDQIKEMLVHSSLSYLHDYLREKHAC